MNKKIKLTDMQKQIWESNYKGPNDNTIQDTFQRVATAIAEVQKDQQTKDMLKEEFFKMLSEFKFIPGGRILANAGTKTEVGVRDKATLFNCYVIHPYDIGIRDIDSMQGIFQSLKKSAQILASQGGLGINFTYIRPNGLFIKGTGARTPGVVKFMQIWDKASQIITMGSDKDVNDKYSKKEKKKIRKGAMIGVLDISHQDVLDFINCKQVSNKFTKFNLSVLVSDRFMTAVQNDEDWELGFPNTDYEHYAEEWNGDLQDWITSGKPFIVQETVKARDLWQVIMKATYNRNQPGVLFYGNLNNLNPGAYCEKIITTNPCGQIGMPTGVCNLGNINLVQFYRKEDNSFDYEQFYKTIKFAVVFLDNVNEVSYLPIKDYESEIIDKRRIGLGVTGLGSLLYMMNIKFGSEQAIQLVDKIFKFKAETELTTSAMLGVSKGSFKVFDPKKYFNTIYWKMLNISNEVKKDIQALGQMRNIVTSTVPPVGNGSLMLGSVSNGIEPVFMKEYIRWMIVPQFDVNKLKRKKIDIPNVKNGEWRQTQIFKVKKVGDDQVLEGQIDGVTYQLDRNRGLIKSSIIRDYGYDYILKHDLPQDGVVQTIDLSVQDHINMLAASAKYINQSQSKTINIPKDYPYEKFKQVYKLAWNKGIKGVTTYRDGTMTAVLQKKQQDKEYLNQLQKLFAENKGVIPSNVKIPDLSYALQYKIKDKDEKKWYITLCFVDKYHKKPFAIFIRTNNRESTQVADKVIEAMHKLVLDMGVDKQLVECQKKKYIGQTNINKIGRSIGMALRHNIPLHLIVENLQENGDGMSTLLFHIRKLLSEYVPDGTPMKGKTCDNCGGENLVYQGGCQTCMDCGISQCG